ncbi:hypothetical protein [Thermoleptolyngbya oregonensis]|uniref:hypothetical protein n=1 Tax=Thermoleptolyngbya oregonensis TaxID=2303529 RepID=UPI002930A6C0|nr:hypothetical protein [Thermoleptolyngbya oregonensis]
MLQIQYFSAASNPEAASVSLPASLPASLPPLLPPRPSRRRLRLYLVGSPADTQHEIDRLHLLHYAERFEWSRVVQIPEGGIVLRPDAGDVLRYLQRDRPLN